MTGVSQAYVGLGANLDAPVQQVTRAAAALAELPSSALRRLSSLYRSAPLGPPDQPDYVNAVAALETGLAPLALLDALQEIERRHGRVRTVHWGPRTLDLDLLVYDQLELRDGRLVLPHPGIAARIFVLEPLYEIAPELTVPGLGPVAALRAARRGDPIERVVARPA